MKKQVVNPYLPSYEYIPDGEPHIFGDRVYVYGSHDRFNAPIFCMNDYVCYSAPMNDLSNWRYEGVIYKKKQDPKNKLGLHLLFAPDVAKGPDGRYYLYYAFDFMGIMGVAVCDQPAGAYQFYGYVTYPNGTLWGRKKGDQFPFDPAVLVDDGHVYLYSGFYISVPRILTGFVPLRADGGVVMELEPDMKTIKTRPKLIFPKQGKGAYTNHEFFEASSIRKYDNQYIFVYSSRHNHELCYAISDRPDGEFKFGGTLVSLGDLFLNGNEDEQRAVNYLGNTHGGLLHIDQDWYIFYHRQTNRHSYSRQACAERLIRDKDGSFRQAEVTSCGLNGGPLRGRGRYEARIACNLWSKDGVARYDQHKNLRSHPYFTQDGKDREHHGNQYIANMRDGATAGFKYFDIQDMSKIMIEVRGKAKGRFVISTSPNFESIASVIPVDIHSKRFKKFSSLCHIEKGVRALYFQYQGKGSVDFMAFTMK